MLIGLLAGRFAPAGPPSAGRRIDVAAPHPDRTHTVLRSIADKISEHGDGALTDEERLIWNTALVISIMAGSDRMTMPPAAEILSWGSARAGFREMRLPVLAEIVRMIVLELVFRADRADGNGAADEASLLRLAELKRRFQEIDADIDLPLQLGRMIDRLYR